MNPVIITKLKPATFCKTFFPLIETHLINQLISVQTAAAYRHTKCKHSHSLEHGVPIVGKFFNAKILNRLQSHKWNTLWKSLQGEAKPEFSKINERLQNVKIPSLSYISNILRAQPKQVWRAIWAPQNKTPEEWPIFNRSKQYQGDLKKSLLKNQQIICLPSHTQKELKEIQEQQYLPHRVRNLGPDLAAVHFFIDRRAAVKLANQESWIVGGAPKLSSIDRLNRCISGSFLDEECYMSRCYIEALDCSNFNYNGVRYEGLKYLTGLRFLKWLSLRNQKYINVWCLDRIAGYTGETLEYLDISKCDLDLGCIVALMKMPALQTLVIKEPEKNDGIKSALSILEEANPKLNIRAISKVLA